MIEWDTDIDGELDWLEFYHGPHVAQRPAEYCNRYGPNGNACQLVRDHPGERHAVISLSGLVMALWPRASTVSEVELDAKKRALYKRLAQVRDDIDSTISFALADYRAIIRDIRVLKCDTTELLYQAEGAQNAVNGLDLMDIGPSEDEEDWT